MPGLKRSLVEGPATDNSCESERLAPGSEPQTKRIRVSEEHRQDDGNSDEETDEEIQTLQATQFHEKQKSRYQEQNGPAENGIIESITLTNFMCHSFLHVEIGPLINFIIGHNGSGKSAVLTALTICLGGKASATNRASSLKSFIKEGTETSTLSVKIKNGGDDGYQQELYGNSVIVERSFSRSGASSFKLKNSNGRIMSTKRSDLEDISDYYALQLDNPINVLTQDNARQFLSGSGPTDKYKFFIKGVQLEQLNRDYDLLHESIAQMETTFEDKRLRVQQLKQMKDHAKSLYDLLGHNESLHSKIQFVRSQMAWTQVENQERNLKQAERDLQQCSKKVDEVQREVETASVSFTEAEETRNIAVQEQNLAQEETNKLAEEEAAARETQNKYKAEALNAQQDERSIDADIRTAQDSIKSTKDEIEAEKARLEQVNGGSIARHIEALEIKKREVEEARQRHRLHVATKDDLVQERMGIQEERKGCENRKNTKIEEKAACQTRLRELRNQGQRRGFKPNMNKLVDAIAKSKDFHEKPIGPIGEHIQLKDPQWLSILERSFGDVLEGFIVTSKADQSRLTELMRKVSCQTSVIIGSRVAIDTSNHEPNSQFDTILRVLRIDNEIVKRQLIINQGIEQTILVPSIKDAREMMSRSRLENVKQCFSHQPHSPKAGERFNYGLAGSLNSSFISAWNKLPRMRTQIEDSIAFEQNFLKRLEHEEHEINVEAQYIEKKIATCRQEEAAHEKTERGLKADVQSAQHQCDEIQERIDADNIEEGRLDVLRQTLATYESEQAHHQNVRDDAVREKEKHNGKWKAMEREIREIEGRFRLSQSRLKAAKNKSRKCEEARQSSLIRKNSLHESLARTQEQQTAMDEQRVELEGIVADFSRQASAVGQRVPIEDHETMASLDQKLAKLENDLRMHEQRVGGSAEKITKDYEYATNVHLDAFTQFETEEKLAQLLRQTLNAREERWRLFRQKISARARATFVFVLSERSFHGHLKINHRQRKLEISVQPDDTQRDRSGREASSLSGGEKSYSTICLLLSLWDAVGAPIRCLDEFDVYMDSVNREISMKLLVRAARNAAGRQFILISPQAGIINSSPDVKIIKLQDPERNQSRLVLGNQQ